MGAQHLGCLRGVTTYRLLVSKTFLLARPPSQHPRWLQCLQRLPCPRGVTTSQLMVENILLLVEAVGVAIVEIQILEQPLHGVRIYLRRVELTFPPASTRQVHHCLEVSD